MPLVLFQHTGSASACSFPLHTASRLHQGDVNQPANCGWQCSEQEQQGGGMLLLGRALSCDYFFAEGIMSFH